jgi:hypothetical protein
MVVVAIEQQDIDLGPAQRAGCVQAAESAPNNDDGGDHLVVCHKTSGLI